MIRRNSTLKQRRAPATNGDEPIIAAPRDASTVIVVRDGDTGIEAYMLRRSPNSPAMPDAYVFPGGTVEVGDTSPQARMCLTGRWRPAEPAFTYAAIRETFEECGLLFCTEPVDRATLRAARTKLLAGARSFSETLIDLDRRLDAGAVHFFSRWITPSAVPHRFDARFYVARAPDGQDARADAIETHDGRWLRPTDAVAAAGRDELRLIFPTFKHLERIAQFERVDDLLAFADTKQTNPVTPDVHDGPTFAIPAALENSW